MYRAEKIEGGPSLIEWVVVLAVVVLAVLTVAAATGTGSDRSDCTHGESSLGPVALATGEPAAALPEPHATGCAP